MKRILFLIFIVTLLSTFIFAQNESGASLKNISKTIEFDKISIVEIPQKIEEVLVFITEINAIEIPATEIEKLEENFATFQKEIDPLRKESNHEKFKNTTTKKLKDYKLKWDSYLQNIGDFKNSIQAASERLDGENQQIKLILKNSITVYSKAKKEKAPRTLLNRIRGLQNELKKTEKALFSILSKVLTLRDKVSIEEIFVKEVSALIDKQIEENRSLLFTFDSPPLWVVLTDSTDTTTLASSITLSTTRVGSALFEFWDMYSEEVPYYIGFYIIVLFVILYLKRFSRKSIKENKGMSTKFSSKILNKPFSISILIAIYFVVAFFPLAPSVIAELSRIILVIPIIFLFPTFVSKVSRGPLYFITSIYLFQQIIELLISPSIYLSLSVILLTVLMITGLYWFVVLDFKKLSVSRKKLLNSLRIISKFLIAILLISLIGNIIGNTTLSTLIFSGVMRTIYISLILITSVQVFNTLIAILLETKIVSFSYIMKRKSTELKNMLFGLVKFLAIIILVVTFLKNFEIYDAVTRLLLTLVTTPLAIGTFSITFGNVLLFFFSVWLSTKFSKIIRFFFENEVFPRFVLPRGVPAAVSLIMNYTILSLGFIIALSFLGFNIEKFAIVAGALSVGIGFGMQNIVNNFISGLILLFERPIQVGDTISLSNNLIGSVKRIGIRASIIQTFDGSEVIVPNADLISGRVTNWTLSDNMRRIEIKIGVHFSAKPNIVMDILYKALEEKPDILKNPAPYILYKGHRESTQDFDLRFWTSNSGDWIFLRSDVLLKITEMLNEAGIEIPYQQQNVYLNYMDKKQGSEK